jgi:serine/threonine-protein kinase
MTQTHCPATGLAIQVAAPRNPAKDWDVPTKAPPPRTRPSAPPPPGPPALESNARRDLIGQMIGGRYIVRSVLGEGGMGTVFEAEHVGLGRAVAVKVLHPHQLKKKVSVKRFHQEARAAGAIGHPNICEVYDLGTLDDGSPYLVMEKLVGETLADRIASEGWLPFEDVIEILTQVLSGLVAAHEKRIVHRDIKPENVFLTRRVGCPPVAKILDFGVSKMMYPGGEHDEDMDLTRTGMVMGTPFYMSPEQARGDRNLDARVDLWACGVILYESITGRRPFMAANYNALLMQILTTPPRPARELRPALPPGFDLVLARALERDRGKRYQSATELQHDLLALRERIPISQRTPPSRRGYRMPTPIPAAGRPPSVEIPIDVGTPPSGSLPAEPPDPPSSDLDEAPTQVLHRSPRRPLEQMHDWELETRGDPRAMELCARQQAPRDDDTTHRGPRSDRTAPTKVRIKR